MECVSGTGLDDLLKPLRVTHLTGTRHTIVEQKPGQHCPATPAALPSGFVIIDVIQAMKFCNKNSK